MFVFIGKLYYWKLRINFKLFLCSFHSHYFSFKKFRLSLPFVPSSKRFCSHLFCLKPQLWNNANEIKMWPNENGLPSKDSHFKLCYVAFQKWHLASWQVPAAAALVAQKQLMGLPYAVPAVWLLQTCSNSLPYWIKFALNYLLSEGTGTLFLFFFLFFFLPKHRFDQKGNIQVLLH